jgi:two-component sensor histidine kinase
MKSLQLASALLRLQSQAFEGSDAAEQIAIAASRVATISRVHQHFYTAEGASARPSISSHLA